MKFFQQLWLTPAALGLLTPLGAIAFDINNIDVKRSHTDQISMTSYPLKIIPSELSYAQFYDFGEHHNCSVGNNNQLLRSNLIPSNQESFLLGGSCFDSGLIANGESLEPEDQQVVDEFVSEMTKLKNRIDLLEGKFNQLSANQFSSTTKLSGNATFTFGASTWERGSTDSEAFHSNYSYKLFLNTSFSGNDFLRLSLEAGNYSATSPLLLESIASTGNEFRVESLYYSFPFGEFTVAAGPLYELDKLSAITSTYSNSFFFNGYYIGPNSFSSPIGISGTGAGFSYLGKNGFSFGTSFAAVDGSNAELGIGTNDGNDALSISAGYNSTSFGGGLTYAKLDSPTGAISELAFSLTGLNFDENPEAFGIGFYWTPTENFDISAGIDFLDVGISGYEDGMTFSIGADLDLLSGVLSAGIASVPDWDANNNYDPAGMAYELYYSYKISEAISIKPGLMITTFDRDQGFDSIRYAIETTFQF